MGMCTPISERMERGERVIEREETQERERERERESINRGGKGHVYLAVDLGSQPSLAVAHDQDWPGYVLSKGDADLSREGRGGLVVVEFDGGF